MTCIKGYKAFNYDLTCRDYQFEVGKLHIHEGPLEMCAKGFHYCVNPIDVINYYDWKYYSFRVFEIEAGESITEECKSVTLSIKLVREISKNEMMKLCTGVFERPNGLKVWLRDGVKHRDDGPAEVTTDYEKWYNEGVLHRDNGPAVLYYGYGGKTFSETYEQYYKNGIKVNPFI